MWETVPRLLAQQTYLVLATADGEGRPWATPLFYAAQHEHLVYWVSAPDSRHSRNIAEQPTVAITIFDSRAPIGGAEALYLEGQGHPSRERRAGNRPRHTQRPVADASSTRDG